MIDELLKTDCQKCAALCCAAFAFDKSEDFAITKAAGEPCPHVASDFGCKIHDKRVESGFPGCLRYDCHGAGPRVVHEIFGGQDWRDHPDLLHMMTSCLRDLQRVHEAMAMLHEAGKLGLPPKIEDYRQVLLMELAMVDDWTPESLLDFIQSERLDHIHMFLRSLRDHVNRR